MVIEFNDVLSVSLGVIRGFILSC